MCWCSRFSSLCRGWSYLRWCSRFSSLHRFHCFFDHFFVLFLNNFFRFFQLFSWFLCNWLLFFRVNHLGDWFSRSWSYLRRSSRFCSLRRSWSYLRRSGWFCSLRRSWSYLCNWSFFLCWSSRRYGNFLGSRCCFRRGRNHTA